MTKHKIPALPAGRQNKHKAQSIKHKILVLIFIIGILNLFCHFNFIISYLHFGFCNFAFAANAGENDSEQQLNDFSLAGYGDKGKKTWDITGKSADMFTENIIFKKVIGNLYGETENVQLTADKGDFNKAESKIRLEQDVVITTSSGTKLTTESLDWDRKNNVVSTKDKVNIKRNNMVTTSLGATGQPGLNKVNLDKDIKLEITPDEAKNIKDSGINAAKIIITCDGPLSIDYEKNLAVFTNNVKVERLESQIYSDEMNVYFVKDSGKGEEKSGSSFMNSKIDKIVARGNVKVVQGENISYSEEAVYNAADKKITLSGKPKLVIYSAEAMNASFGN